MHAVSTIGKLAIHGQQIAKGYKNACLFPMGKRNFNWINIQLKFFDVGTLTEVIPINFQQITQPRSQLTYASWQKLTLPPSTLSGFGRKTWNPLVAGALRK
jgi:hypothetical protein